jgi:hypothetical protein
LLLLIPVKVINVASDSGLVVGELFRVVLLAKSLGNAPNSTCHHAHPADQVNVQFARVRRLRSGVVINAGSEDVLH